MDAILRIPYAQKDAAKLAARAGGGQLIWQPESKTWRFHGPALPAALQAYRQDTARARTFLLDVPFPRRAEAQEAGALWDGERKAYAWRGVALPAALGPFRASDYSWEAYQEVEINGGTPRPARPPLGMTPRAHQTTAIAAILAAARAGRQGFLLADDVGLGKTLSALEAALQLPALRTILVVCPLAVVAHWRQTIARLGDRGKRIVVINYDRLGKLFEAPPPPPPRTARRGKKKAAAGVRKSSKRTLHKRLAAKGAFAAHFDCVLLDESHRLRNVTTLRSKFAARLVQDATFTIWLSATAGQNPLELAYLAPLLAQVTGSTVRDLADFETWCRDQGLGVCRGAFGKWIWDRDGATASQDLERMRRLLFTGRVPAGLRRRPEDLVGWPEVNRVLFPVAIEGEDRRLYDQEWADFCRAMRLAGPRGRESKNALVARLRFRQKASLLRVPGTLALIEDLLDNGHQVAVSCEFLDTLEALRVGVAAAGHPVVVMHGTQPATEKERNRLAFQRGQATVVIYTVTEAISLHAGDELARGNHVRRANVVADCRYSAIACAQVEGRCHRDGQHATVYYVFGEETVEESIVQTMIQRLLDMKAMHGDDTATLRAIEALLYREATRAAA